MYSYPFFLSHVSRNMVRNRERKTNIGMTPEKRMKKAVQAVIKDGYAVLAASKEYGIPRQTLAR